MSKKKISNLERGSKAEREFSKRLMKNNEAKQILKNKFAIEGDLIESHPTGGNLKKSDVLLVFSGNQTFGANIKSGKSDFNQVTRLWANDFCDRLQLSCRTRNIITTAIDNYRLNISKTFINEEDRPFLAEEFKKKINDILELIFRNKNDVVKLLVIYCATRDVFYTYDIQDVLDYLINENIDFSKKGIVKIGNYITMQRKGGNGVKIKLPKNSPNHPGNQIQFKMRILSFVDNFESPLFVLDK